VKFIIIILIGLISIFASCNKTVTVRLKLYYGDSLVVGNWMQLSGTTNLIFSTLKDSIISLSTNGKPKAGTYMIQAIWGKDTATYKYVLQ
jgi:hypothetical protein